MDVRISLRKDECGDVVRIEGRLDALAVPDLLAACRSVGHPLRLDLFGLRSADADGADALRCLTETGAEFTDMSPYIRQLVLPNSGSECDRSQRSFRIVDLLEDREEDS